MARGKRWNLNSLTFKLNGPVVLTSAFLLLGVYWSNVLLSIRLETHYARLLTKNIADTLLVTLQQDNQQRVSQIASQFIRQPAIHKVVLIDLASQRVISSTRPDDINQPVAVLGNDFTQIYLPTLAPGKILLKQVEEQFFALTTLAVAATDAHSARLQVFIDFYPQDSWNITRNLERRTLMLVAATLILQLLILLLVQRIVVIKRLTRLRDRMQTEMTRLQAEIPESTQGDELDAVHSIFTRLLTVKNDAEQTAVRAQKLAERYSRARSLFLANMSHELRTPLNAIIGFSTRLLKNEPPLKTRDQHVLHIIQKSGRHLLRQINDILDLSKLDAGQLELHFGEIDIHTVLQEVLTEFKVEIQEKGLSLKTHITEHLMLETDEQRFRQIVITFLSNAIKYTEQGSITIEAFVNERGYFQVSITDTGIGIQNSDQKHLFERFEYFDENSTQKIGQGCGLGLAISREIVTLMGGDIGIESEFGVGSRFSIYLPLSRTLTEPL